MFELFSSVINPTKDGTVFDSSAARNAPFGPFVHGRGQIIQVFHMKSNYVMIRVLSPFFGMT